MPERRAEAVARLEAAGYANVGKTNLHEFAYSVTSYNPHFGEVPNPSPRAGRQEGRAPALRRRSPPVSPTPRSDPDGGVIGRYGFWHEQEATALPGIVVATPGRSSATCT